MKLSFREKYKEGKKIGQGKMGVVYQVQKKIPNEQPQQIYAAKHISLNKIDLQIAKKQLRILQQLKHMYIVRYYQDFIQNDELVLIMDYCEGKDLHYHIEQMKAKGKFFNQTVVSTWIFQLILVLQYIHSCNIIHRDIKPQNIFVDKDMNLKIGDFGVSKLLDGTENCKTIIGTPFYFSPELAKDQSYSKKTDIWSLGCVNYEICTLAKPFQTKKGFLGLCNAIQNQQPKNIPSFYSPDLNKLIRKMLTKDPNKRPTSRELLQDPILVQLMINFSSSVNLKQEIQQKPLSQPFLTNSFIDSHMNALNSRMINFQQQIQQKMEGLKKKKVRASEVDRSYNQVKQKMAKLQELVQNMFVQMKQKAQKDQQNQSVTSNLSDSDETIMSKNFSEAQKKNSKPILTNNSSSMSMVDSIMIKSKTKELKRSENEDLSATVMTQFMQTIKQSQNPEQIKKSTLSHLEQIQSDIKTNPNLVLDDNYLAMTLSLSSRAGTLFFNKYDKKKKQKDLDFSHGSSSNTLNFDFIKKQNDDSLGISSKKIIYEQIDSCKDQSQKYEADFQSYQEDKDFDMRKQQIKSVKQLFASTLKNFSGCKSEDSPMKNRTKYGLTLSTIRQQNSQGGSTISSNANSILQ